MWHKGSKPVVCRFLDIELEAQIGDRGFEFAILEFTWCPRICHKLQSCNPILMPFVLFDSE